MPSADVDPEQLIEQEALQRVAALVERMHEMVRRQSECRASLGRGQAEGWPRAGRGLAEGWRGQG